MEINTELGRLLSKLLQGKITSPESMSQMEQITREAALEIGRQALNQWLIDLQDKSPEKSQPCPHCKRDAAYKRERQGKLRTVLGVVYCRRSYYLCPECRSGHYPLDQALGLRPNRMSAELERLGGMAGVQAPFGQGSQMFQALTLVGLSDHSLAKATQAYGAEMEQIEKEWGREALDAEALLRQKREKKGPLRLYGAVDATKVHLREEEGDAWRDLKIGAWFEARGRPPKKPEGDWQIKADKISYYTDICPSKEFSPLIWATGVQRQAHLARELIFLGDGAEWIWNNVVENFPNAVQILDWFHACEYLAPVAKVAFATKERQQTWVAEMKAALWDGQVQQVIDSCLSLVDARREEDPAAKAATYYNNNRSRMDYPSYRAQGYHIGSGTIESGAKQIGSQRMKVAGARWNKENARYVAKARAAFLSGQWEMLASRRKQLPLAI
jgi:hypothetical protein